MRTTPRRIFARALNFSDPQSGVYSNRFYRTLSPRASMSGTDKGNPQTRINP